MPRQPHHHRHRYHDGSLHFGILNWLIGFVVILCLFNAWTSPPPSVLRKTAVASTVYEATNSVQGGTEEVQQQLALKAANSNPIHAFTMSGGAGSIARQGLLQVERPSLSKGDAKSSTSETGSRELTLPMNTVIDGRQVVVLAPSDLRQQHQGYPANTVMRSLEHAASNRPLLSPTGTLVELELPNTKTATKRKKGRMSSHARGLSDATDVQSSFRSSEGGRDSTPPYYRTGRFVSDSSSSRGFQMPSFFTFSWAVYIVAITGSVVGGGILARRALDRADRWEQLSKEDSLAFDIAYTSNYTDLAGFQYADESGSDASYGSFAASPKWSGDRLDRFDV